MATSYKRHALSLLEVILSITLLALTLPTIGVAAHRLLGRFQYSQEIEALKNQLQMAHDMTLHTHVPVEITLESGKRGLECRLGFENKMLDERVLSDQSYTHLSLEGPDSTITLQCSPSGAMPAPVTVSVSDKKHSRKSQMMLKGYPHVIHVFSNP